MKREQNDSFKIDNKSLFSSRMFYLVEIFGFPTKIEVFWDVMPCSLIDRYKYLHLQENGGSRFLQNVGTYVPNCMATFPLISSPDTHYR
jgi:hypothetical protein